MPVVLVVTALAVVAVAAIVAAVVAATALRRARSALAEAELQRVGADAESAALHQRLDDLERRLVRVPGTQQPQEYVITHLGELDADDDGSLRAQQPTRVTLAPPAFADAVLRETVVHTASFVHGVRRALAPETRNRIRFEMRREVKRSRKARKLEVKEALRDYRARQRATAPEDRVDEPVA